jgi:glycosyltransferase involved in cell wall biosynthesis
MKILFYNHTGQVSGAERLLTTILARLDRRRFAAQVVCPDNGPLAGMVESLGLPCEAIGRMEARFTWRIDRLLGSLANCYGVARELRRRVVASAPDVVHANSIRAGLVATLATAGLNVPVVWHLHDLLPAHALSTAIRAAAALSPRARLLAISDAVARNFCGVLLGKTKNRPPITTILNAIEVECFRASEAQGRAVRDELGLNGAGPVLGIVGHLAPRKGQLELLRAFAEVVKEVPDAVLLVVGAAIFERDYARQLKETTHDLGLSQNVRFVGPREDMAAVMRALDVLVVNSWAEPFGLVVLEAMAAGTPVLATAAGGVPEIIRHGETGYLVPPRDQQALAAAILTLTRRPALRRQLAARACAEVKARFCFERYMRELEAFYLGCARS